MRALQGRLAGHGVPFGHWTFLRILRYVYLTRKGRALEAKLVPLAEEVNRIAVRGASAGDVRATRRTLIAVIENLSRSSPRKP